MRARFARFLFLIGIIAAIVPIIPCSAAPATTAVAVPVTTIDWSQGNIQDTQASCGEFVFKNLQDRHSYSLLVRGTVSGTCSFEAEGLHFHMSSNYGATTDRKMTIFNFIRFGSDVVVTWQPDY